MELYQAKPLDESFSEIPPNEEFSPKFTVLLCVWLFGNFCIFFAWASKESFFRYSHLYWFNFAFAIVSDVFLASVWLKGWTMSSEMAPPYAIAPHPATAFREPFLQQLNVFGLSLWHLVIGLWVIRPNTASTGVPISIGLILHYSKLRHSVRFTSQFNLALEAVCARGLYCSQEDLWLLRDKLTVNETYIWNLEVGLVLGAVGVILLHRTPRKVIDHDIDRFTLISAERYKWNLWHDIELRKDLNNFWHRNIMLLVDDDIWAIAMQGILSETDVSTRAGQGVLLPAGAQNPHGLYAIAAEFLQNSEARTRSYTRTDLGLAVFHSATWVHWYSALSRPLAEHLESMLDSAISVITRLGGLQLQIELYELKACRDQVHRWLLAPLRAESDTSSEADTYDDF